MIMVVNIMMRVNTYERCNVYTPSVPKIKNSPTTTTRRQWRTQCKSIAH